MNPTILLLATAVAQAPTAPIIHYDFKDTYGQWMGAGPTGKISLDKNPDDVAPNKGALKFDYAVAKGGFNVMVLPTPVGTLAKAKSIKFNARSDANTLVGVILQEQDGGRYVALVNAPGNTWQPIELSTSDFDLSLDKDAPKDPDGKLDMDLVNSITIVDLAQMFAQVDNPTIQALLAVRSGPHHLLIQDFDVSPTSIPGWTSNSGDDVLIDTFVHPQIAWFNLGAGSVAKAVGGPISGPSLKWECREAPGKITGLTRPMSPWILSSTKSISFDVASVQPTKLVVQLEDTEGGKYNTTLDVPPSTSSTHMTLHYADFKPAEDSADPHGMLDVTKVKTLTIIDAAGFTVTEEKPNTLWIGNLRASSKS